ncbi:MAG: DUF72 domain-containing protein [Thermoleophilaceae bacterium]
MAGRILVGTSSWADPGFVAEWYPQGMPARERLRWYSDRFELVEVNSSFYAVPEPATVMRWAEITPDRFTFDYKLHKLLSRHSAELESLPPDLRDGVETNARGRVKLTPEIEAAMVDATVEAVAPLEEAGKLGALLLQLTPAFSPRKHELDELAPLIERFAPRPVAVELRNRNWVSDGRADATFAWMSEHGAAFVTVDAPPGEEFSIMPPVDAVTRDDLAYVRVHGRNTEGYLKGKTVAERFGWEYSDEELEEIRKRAEAMAEEGVSVHVAFNNNRGRDAPTSARRFRQLLGQDPGPPPEEPQLRIG